MASDSISRGWLIPETLVYYSPLQEMNYRAVHSLHIDPSIDMVVDQVFHKCGSRNGLDVVSNANENKRYDTKKFPTLLGQSKNSAACSFGVQVGGADETLSPLARQLSQFAHLPAGGASGGAGFSLFLLLCTFMRYQSC